LTGGQQLSRRNCDTYSCGLNWRTNLHHSSYSKMEQLGPFWESIGDFFSGITGIDSAYNAATVSLEYGEGEKAHVNLPENCKTSWYSRCTRNCIDNHGAQSKS